MLCVMNEKHGVRQSQLFTLRLWVEDVENGRTEIRGTLKHILTGETHHFRDWPTLIRHLEISFAPSDACLGSGDL